MVPATYRNLDSAFGPKFGGGRDHTFDIGTGSRVPGSDHLVGNVHHDGQHTGVSRIQNRTKTKIHFQASLPPVAYTKVFKFKNDSDGTSIWGRGCTPSLKSPIQIISVSSDLERLLWCRVKTSKQHHVAHHNYMSSSKY